MGRHKKIAVSASIVVLLLATSSCTVRKPTGGYLFLPPGSRVTYSEPTNLPVDTLDHTIQEFLAVPDTAIPEPEQEFLAVPDTAIPEPETEIGLVLPAVQISEPPADSVRYSADSDLTLLKESHITDSIVVHDLSSYLAEDKNLSLVDTLSAFLRNIKNEFRVIDYRMVSLENLILSRSAADTVHVVKQVIPEKQAYVPSPEPELKSRQEIIAGETAGELSSELPDTLERHVIIMTDTVYVRIGNAKPDTIVKDGSTDSLFLKLTGLIGAVSDSVESLRRSLGHGYEKNQIRVDTLYLYDDTSALKIEALERNIASLRNAYESELKTKVDSLHNLHRLLSETRAMVTSSDTITFTAYYEANSFVPNNADSLMSALSQIPAPSVREIHVSAFTDASGSALYNKTLSGKRIEYITNLLSESGIEPGKILVQNFGELYAAEDKSDPVRRVEVIIITEQNL